MGFVNLVLSHAMLKSPLKVANAMPTAWTYSCGQCESQWRSSSPEIMIHDLNQDMNDS